MPQTRKTGDIMKHLVNNSSGNLSLLLVVFLGVIIAGCTGGRTFHDYARAGDTVAVAAGYAQNLQRGNIVVTITDNLNTVTTYTPGQAGYQAVRGSVNMYPDPVSSLVLSDRLKKDVTPGARTYANVVNNGSTGNDRDWWETIIFVDLPDPMALGDATIEIADLGATESVSSIVTIVPDDSGTGTGGTANIFEANIDGTQFQVADPHFAAMERAEHFVVSFAGSTVPHAIQVDLTHDADAAHGGAGTPYVVTTVSDIKSLSWAPVGTSGTDVRVIITPANNAGFFTMNDLKFYVAGGVTGLDVVDQDTNDGDLDVLAFDIDGNPLATEVTATVVSMN